MQFDLPDYISVFDFAVFYDLRCCCYANAAFDDRAQVRRGGGEVFRVGHAVCDISFVRVYSGADSFRKPHRFDLSAVEELVRRESWSLFVVRY